MDTREVKYPIEKKISKKVRALVGFRDDRVEIKVRVGFPIGEITLTMDSSDMDAVDQMVKIQKAWMSQAKFVREMKGAK